MKNDEEVKIIFKIDKATKEKFKEYCDEEGRNMTGQLIYWIKKAIGGAK